jgi:hypothetical protein
MGMCGVRAKQIQGNEREVEDNPVINIRFDHSWKPSGPDPGLGWFWILKGNLVMEICYPAHQDEIRRFGYLARRV